MPYNILIAPDGTIISAGYCDFNIQIVEEDRRREKEGITEKCGWEQIEGITENDNPFEGKIPHEITLTYVYDPQEKKLRKRVVPLEPPWVLDQKAITDKQMAEAEEYRGLKTIEEKLAFFERKMGLAATQESEVTG